MKKLHPAWYLVIPAIASAAFCLLFSTTTSPLYPSNVGYDSAFFRLVGQGMTQGLLPYRDFFDMKGPYLFLIEYLGQLICFGSTGILILQTVNLYLSLLLTLGIFRQLGVSSRERRLVMLLPLLAALTLTLQGGNITEEYSLIPLLSCLYICLAFLRHMDSPEPFWSKRVYALAGAWFGLMSGILFFIRINNAAMIAACALCVAIELIRARKPKKLLPCAAGFVGGFALAVAPPVIFCAAHGLLKEFFDAVFVLGYRYSSEQSLLTHLRQMLKLKELTVLIRPVLAAACLIPSVFRYGSRSFRRLLVLCGVFTFIAIIPGNGYTHYCALMLPCFALAEALIVCNRRPRRRLSRKVKLAVAIALLLALASVPTCLVATGKVPARRIKEYLFTEEESALIKDVSSRIPGSDKDSVLAWNVNANFYTVADIYPCIKYCLWQNHYIKLMPGISEDIQQLLFNAPPAWLVTMSGRPKLPGYLDELLESGYSEVYSNKDYKLYRREQ